MDSYNSHDYHMYLTPSSWSGYDTMSILKWSTAGLNSEFSFSQISWRIKAKEPGLLDYLPIAGKEH